MEKRYPAEEPACAKVLWSRKHDPLRNRGKVLWSREHGQLKNWKKGQVGWEGRQWGAWPDDARTCRPCSDERYLSILPNLKRPPQQNYWIPPIHSTQLLIMRSPCPQGCLLLYLNWSFWGNTIKRIDEEMNTRVRCSSSLVLSTY